jgi:hypothetical protein
MKVYVASSWRNRLQPIVVEQLRDAGHDVYDFRNPTEGNAGFHWSDIDPKWKRWTPPRFRDCLDHRIVIESFTLDYEAMKWADTFVLVMPCGRSAHLELGWAIGARRNTAILLDDGEPELMYKLVDAICVNTQEVLTWLRELG